MATQGILVPLTDFTDRLDSVVDGMVGRLHDLVNLFLVVGIAGTVLGMFHFVVSYDPTAKQDLAPLLSLSLGKALPVAFMGLVFYVAGYIVASKPEQDLRDALAKATQGALNRRVEKAKSFAGSTQEAAQALKSAAEDIRGALQPLREFDITLKNVAQAMSDVWRGPLDQTYKLVQTQLAALKEAVSSVNGAVEGVNASIHDLQAVAQGLKHAVAKAPGVLDKMDSLYETQLKRLEELSETISQIRQAASTTSEEIKAANDLVLQTMKRFEALPGQVPQLVEQNLRSVSDKLPDIWREGTRELNQQVFNILSGIKDSADSAKTTIDEAANKWGVAALSAPAAFRDALNDAFKTVKDAAEKEIPEIKQTFGNLFPGAVEKMKEAATQWDTVSARIISLNQELVSLLNQVRETQAPNQTLQKLDAITEGIRQCASEIAKTQRVLGDGSAPPITLLLRDLNKQMALLNQQEREIVISLWGLLTAPVVFKGWKPYLRYPS
jgi:chromosome segregation ATPase